MTRERMGATDSLPERLGPYEIEALIRRGGMGVVYRARHTHLNRIVALKVLPPEIAEDSSFRERFIREAQSAAALHHPNIVTVYDAGEIDGRLFIAMQFIDGPDLGRILRRDGPLTAARAMWIVDQLAQALEAAHARGLIHRDVKPGNVLVDSERAYLTDFGLTKPITGTSVTAPGHFVGTVGYASPEQIRAQRLDARTDVYGLGCLLYRSLAGELPFPHDSDLAVIHSTLYDEVPQLSETRPELPAALDAVIATALAKDADERFGSCGALATAANHALAGKAPAARTAPERPTAVAAEPPTRDMSRVRIRSRLPSTGVAAALVGLGAAAVIAFLIAGGGGGTSTTLTHAGAHQKTSTGTTQAPPVPEVRIDPPTRVGVQPAGIAISNDGVFVANAGDGSLRRVGLFKSKLDPAKTAIGGQPGAVAAGADSVWVVSRQADTVTRVDPSTLGVLARIPVGHQPAGIAIGNGDYAAWVVNEQDGTAMRIDANTNSTTPPGPIKVGRGPYAVATSPHAVFVANRGSGTITQIDKNTRTVKATVATGKRPTALVVAANLLWVANSGDGTVISFDGAAEKIVDRVKVGGHPNALAAAGRYIFVADRGRSLITRIDSTSGKVVGTPIHVADPVALRAVAGYVWVVSKAKGTVTRIELF